MGALSHINAFNAGKKKEAALEIISEWLPKVQKFTAQLDSVNGYINRLKRGNKAAEEYMNNQNRMLQEKGEELDKSNMQSKHEAFELREALRKQKRLLDRIPKDVLESLQMKKVKVR